MESAADQCQTSKLVGSNGKRPPSFSLRSQSLNTLRLRRLFDLFDKNNDGVITVDELSQALRRLNFEADSSELASVVHCHVRPGNDGLQFQDFEAFHRSLNDSFFGLQDDHDNQQQQDDDDEEAQEESDLKEAFKVFDENGDGYISVNELQTVLGKLGFSEGNEIGHCMKMIQSVDRNHDGQVDFSEFKDMMRKTLLR